jgi:hypothetical protein
MALRKLPHPEEAAKQLSRRTHGDDPADRRFPDTLFRAGDDKWSALLRSFSVKYLAPRGGFAKWLVKTQYRS